MHQAQRLKIYDFGPGDPLEDLGSLQQTRYLRCYLGDLGARTILEEPQYFDRDYLSEFIAFYAASSRGYPNICRRLHFFSIPCTRRLLQSAASGSPRSRKRLQDAYLGFSVIRPLPAAPYGRTVLRWYPEREDGRPPRLTAPKRPYTCHVAGVELMVEGLAWQQQDMAVGACATVALWSVLHSSALDEWHSIPTTAEITQFANRGAASGARIYPSNGLSTAQIREAIRQTGLEPVLLEGDIASESQGFAFSQVRFSTCCAALIRSGYPVVLIARMGNDNHAVCMIGCRLDHEQEPAPDEGGVVLMDSRIRYVYLHDDNLGPGVRFEVILQDNGVPDYEALHVVELVASAPDPRVEADPCPDDPSRTYETLTPSHLIAAVPGDLRMSPDTLHREAMSIAESLVDLWDDIAPEDEPNVATRTSFIRLTEYLDIGLRTVLGARPRTLGTTRLALAEQVVPMSRILGVVRLGVGGHAIADVLLDTTEGDGQAPAFCTVVFSGQLLRMLRAAYPSGSWGYGPMIDATG